MPDLDYVTTFGDIILAALEDPFLARYQAQNFREPPFSGAFATYDLLRRISQKSIVAAIIETRINQLAEFAVRQSNPRAPGFQIKPRDKQVVMTPAVEREAERIARWLEHCGNWEWAEKYPQHKVFRRRLDFESWVRQIIRDSLRYDQACSQIIFNRLGKPLCFLPVDASTFRINRDGSGYVQVIQGVPVAEFGPDEIMFAVRRPRTDLQNFGYGYPELIDLIDIITAFLWGFQYNANYFRQGMNTKGILVLSGPMNPEQFQTFRRDFQAMAMGVSAAHRIPMINMTTKDSTVQWLRIGKESADMEYREWMNWLMKVICALYLIDPAEIGFQFGTEGQRAPVFQTNPEARIQAGRDKGLRPLLRALQGWINRWIIHPLNPDFEIVFTGIGDFAEKERADFDRTRATTYVTIDEIRAEHQMPPLPGGLGKLPANPSILQMVQYGLASGAVDLTKVFGGESEESNEDLETSFERYANGTPEGNVSQTKPQDWGNMNRRFIEARAEEAAEAFERAKLEASWRR